MEMSSLRAVNSSAAPALFYWRSTSLWQLKENGGRIECPFSLSTFKGSEEMSLPLQLPQACCYVACTTVWQVGWGYGSFCSPYEKDIFFSRKIPLLQNLLTLLPKSKVERIVNLDFSPWKINFPSGKHKLFSPIASPSVVVRCISPH